MRSLNLNDTYAPMDQIKCRHLIFVFLVARRTRKATKRQQFRAWDRSKKLKYQREFEGNYKYFYWFYLINLISVQENRLQVLELNISLWIFCRILPVFSWLYTLLFVWFPCGKCFTYHVLTSGTFLSQKEEIIKYFGYVMTLFQIQTIEANTMGR